MGLISTTLMSYFDKVKSSESIASSILPSLIVSKSNEVKYSPFLIVNSCGIFKICSLFETSFISMSFLHKLDFQLNPIIEL